MTISAHKYRLPLVTFAESHRPLESNKTLPTLQEVLANLPIQLPNVALLGICEDGVPLLLDLQNARLGSLLVVADDLRSSQHLLDIIRLSLTYQNRPHELQILWGSERSIPGSTAMLKTVALHDREMERTLIHLADIAESRQHGKLLGPTLILLLDDLNLATEIDREARWAMEFLLRNGAQQRVWIVAAQDTASLAKHRLWLERFKTPIFGPIHDLKARTLLSLPEFTEVPASAGVFTVNSQGAWLRFWVPEI